MIDKQREEQAKRLLNDPMYNEAFDSLGESIFNTWAQTSVNDVESREQCWLSLRLLDRIRLHLTSIIETGEMAEKIKQYVFYGTYPFKRTISKVKTIKHKSIVHGLHFKLVAHRSRFLKNVEVCFKTFMELCEEHPEWKVNPKP